MRFTKMQGLGNDYIYINCLENRVSNPSELSIRMSDRHFGIGGDGIVLIDRDPEADFRMRMFNADGSEAEMCGNAARCVGKYIHDRKLSDASQIRLKTGAGIKVLELRLKDGVTQSVRVDMGLPITAPAEIPVLLPGTAVIHYPVSTEGFEGFMTCVSIGNPHAVFFVDDAEHFPVHRFGPLLETNPLFPRRTNVEFATVLNRQEIRMRVWERGSGETMACGTGACATLVAAVMNGLCDRQAVIHLNGGPLTVNWDEASDRVFQEGPAEFVFDGEWPEKG